MTVVAKWQVAYKNQLFTTGQEFEIDERDLPKLMGDVLVKKEKNSKEVTKKIVNKVSKK